MVEIPDSGNQERTKPVSLGSDISSDESARRNAEPPRIGNFDLYSPADLRFDEPASGEPARRRGRPKGSRNVGTRVAEKASQNNLIESFESLLLSTHFMLAKLLEVDELELDAGEAKRLSDAFKKVAEFYPMGLSPKRLAWAELSIAAGTIYGPRVVTIYKKKPKTPAPPVRVMPSPAQPPAKPAPAPNGAPAASQQQQQKGAQTPSQLWSQAVNDDALSDQA
jgi:hypothetical protein